MREPQAVTDIESAAPGESGMTVAELLSLAIANLEAYDAESARLLDAGVTETSAAFSTWVLEWHMVTYPGGVPHGLFEAVLEWVDENLDEARAIVAR